MVLGDSPPESIKILHNDKDIKVTGYVEDIREYIASSTIMILPILSSGGFRTRVVEVMALGIPIVGTHKALDSIEMLHGEHGFITDATKKIAQFSIDLLKNNMLKERISFNSKHFVKNKYTIEATYGKVIKELANS